MTNIFKFLLIGAGFLFALLSSSVATAQSTVCKSDIQGKIAWNYEGRKDWSNSNVDKLCAGAESSHEPAKCFYQIMHGRGENWQWKDALNICAGSLNSTQNIKCVDSQSAMGKSHAAMVTACNWNSVKPKPLSPVTTARLQVNQVPNVPKPPNGDKLPIGKDSMNAKAQALAGINVAALRRNQRNTSFDPKIHGFRFYNGFQNNFISEVDWKTNGLCGGMTDAALDYFFAGKPVPSWRFMPAEHDPLRKYIYDRQVESHVQNASKWIELGFNPFGARSDEFFNWGLQGTNGGRLEELKAKIDAGKPVSLGLQPCGEDSCTGSHWVLAIGYDFGRYKGDLGAHKEDVKIKVYDPNYPNQTKTLIPDLTKKRFMYAEEAGRPYEKRTKWLTYFVNTNYTPRRPPNIGPDTFPDDGKIHALALRFHTGEDDLRGGGAGLDVTINLHNAPPLEFKNVNHSQRWVSNSFQTVRLDLARPIDANQIKSVKLRIRSTSMFSQDNWDLDEFSIYGIGHNIDEQIYRAPNSDTGQASPGRFTGSKPVKSFLVNADTFPDDGKVYALALWFHTGNDDLRGGGSDLDVTINLHNAPPLAFKNVNKSQRWVDKSTHTVRLDLARPIEANQIKSVKLQIRKTNSFSQDNWDLDAFSVHVIGRNFGRRIFITPDEGAGRPNKPGRFTGSNPAKTFPVIY